MLSPEKLSEFNKKGFLVIEGLFSDEELASVDRDLLRRLDELSGYLNVDLSEQKNSINNKMMELERKHPGASLIFTHSNIIDPGLFNLWSSDKILSLAEAVLGADIDGHPFFAVRPKPPEVDLFVVPWHQDSSYLADGAQEATQLTFWIPLVDANINNGCMEMAVGEHHNGEKRHVAQEYEELGNPSWYLEIEPSLVSAFDTEVSEMKRGDVIMFTHLTPHRSSPNLSDGCRWSLDMRYIQSGHFPGTSQSTIPFRRANPELNGHIEKSKLEFLQGQQRRDRNIWRHKIERSVWRERWN